MPTILHPAVLTADAPTVPGDDGASTPPATGRRTSTMVVVGSLFMGLASALVLVAGPFAGTDEGTTTGAILLGFAIGWALLATVSTRRADGSHRWAAVPAAALSATGVALIVLAPGAEALDALGWVWPPAIFGLATWMTVQVHRRPRPRSGAWVLYPTFAFMAITALGGAYQTIAASTEDRPAPVAGDRLIDVGGHRLNIRCSGSGNPVVILEPGLGEPSSEMGRLIAPQVAHTTRICIYDRAGHGRSDVAPNADAARDLHVLLKRAGIPGPIVLAGHSLGGMFALAYADRYAADVAGVALIDSMHPKQTHTAADLGPAIDLVPTLTRTGIARLLFNSRNGRPEDQARQLARDVEQMPAELDLAAHLNTLGDLPLGVVTAGSGSQPGWARAQDELAGLSSRSFHRTVPAATHASLVLDREDTRESSRAIEDVVMQVRSER